MKKQHTSTKAQRDRLAAGIEYYIERNTWDNYGIVNVLAEIGVDFWSSERYAHIERLREGLLSYGHQLPSWQYVIIEYELWRADHEQDVQEALGPRRSHGGVLPAL